MRYRPQGYKKLNTANWYKLQPGGPEIKGLHKYKERGSLIPICIVLRLKKQHERFN